MKARVSVKQVTVICDFAIRNCGRGVLNPRKRRAGRADVFELLLSPARTPYRVTSPESLV